MSDYGVGASLGKMNLVGMGQDQQRTATAMLGQAADEEQKREIQNKQMERARKQQNTSLASTVGTVGGMVIGTEVGGSVGGIYGAAIGAVVGAIAGQFF